MLEDEHKHQWAKWMKWTRIGGVHYVKYGKFSPKPGNDIWLYDWNPDSPDCPDSVWREIWANMTQKEMEKFIDILFISFVKEREAKGINNCPLGTMYSFFLTTTPEIRCKILDEIIPVEEDKK